MPYYSCSEFSTCHSTRASKQLVSDKQSLGYFAVDRHFNLRTTGKVLVIVSGLFARNRVILDATPRLTGAIVDGKGELLSRLRNRFLIHDLSTADHRYALWLARLGNIDVKLVHHLGTESMVSQTETQRPVAGLH